MAALDERKLAIIHKDSFQGMCNSLNNVAIIIDITFTAITIMLLLFNMLLYIYISGYNLICCFMFIFIFKLKFTFDMMLIYFVSHWKCNSERNME